MTPFCGTETPYGLLSSNITTTTVTLTWQASEAADGYRIERRTSGGGWSTAGTTSGATTFDDSGLLEGTRYEYQVAATNSSGDSESGPMAFVTTELSAPTGLMAEVQPNDDIKLTWTDNSSNESGFKIEQLENTTSGWIEVGSVGSGVTMYTATGAVADKGGFFRVHAYTSDTESDYSNAAADGAGAGTFDEIIDGMKVIAPENVSIISGQRDFFWNKVAIPPSLSEALMGESIIDAGIGHGDGPLLNVAYDFSPGDLVNGPGPDLIFFSMSSTPAGFTLTANGSSISVGGATSFGESRFWFYETNQTPGSLQYDVLYSTYDLSELGIAPGESLEYLELQAPSSGDWLGVGSLNGSPSAVDITIKHVPDPEEESVGGVVAVNSNRDEANVDGNGEPVADNVEDTSAGHRIVGESDPQLLPATLSLLGTDGLQGKYTLTYDSKIKIWKDDGAGGFTEIVSGIESEEITITGSEERIDIWIEGIMESTSAKDVEIRAAFTPTGDDPSGDEDIVKLTVIDVDLDVDANNDDAIDDSDDPVEDITNNDDNPGKVILVNDADTDGDSLPDYLDGFDYIPGYANDDVISGGQFVPIQLNIPDSLSNPLIEITYSASSPSHITESVNQTFILPAGHLRIWKSDASTARNKDDVKFGGDFLAPGQYTKFELGTSGDQTTFYVEAIRASEAVADLTVSIIVRDQDTGLVLEDQVRFTATRFEIEGINFEGNWEPVDHFVASTLTSGDAEGLKRAWQTYRVNIYDPRQSGISSIDIEGQPLALSNIVSNYQTAEFYALTGDSVWPASASHIVISGPDIDWEYNPGGKSNFIDLSDFNEWDSEITQAVRDAIDEMEAESWIPINPNNPGAFGQEVDIRVRNKLRGKPGWLVDLAVDKDLKVKLVANQLGDTQLDVVRVKAGYNPQVGETLNASKIDDVYELKTSASGSVSRKQKSKLTRVLNGGDANGPRKIKPTLAPKRYSPQSGGSFIENPRYNNGLRLLTFLGVAAGSVQQAHAMWSFNAYDPDFENLINEARMIRKLAGTDKQLATLQWISIDLNQFLSNKFPALPDAARGLGLGIAARKFLGDVE